MVLIFSFCATLVTAQDYFTVRGYVYDNHNLPLQGVEIRVRNTGLGTLSNENGQYQISLEAGLNRLIFSYIGFETQAIDLVVNSNIVKNIWLVPDETLLNAVEITRKKRDISYEVIEQVINRKDSVLNLFQTHRCEVYLRSVEEVVNRENKKDDLPEEAEFEHFENGKSPLTSENDSSDKTPNMNLYEAQLIRHFSKPDLIKENRLAVKRYGDQGSLFYTSTTEGDFNLYANLMYVRTLGQNALVSPLSNTAFISYKFRISDIYFEENGQKVYKIKVIPRKLGNALFKGELEVYENIWLLKSAHLEVPKTALILYDEFAFNILYAHPDSIHIPVRQEFTWSIKNSKQQIQGKGRAVYQHHKFDSTYHKKFFNSELRVTEREAYLKDTSFWNVIRPEPLTEQEQLFVRYNDSMKMVRSSMVYLDSIYSVYNQITPLKLLWTGQGIVNRARKENIEFSPLVSLIDPVAIGGWRLRYFLSYFKRYENRKTLYIAPFVNYGFKNADLKGSLYVSYLYDPVRISSLSVSGGRYFDFVNPFAPISNILRRDNFFEKNYLNVYHQTELVNGLYLGLSVDMEARQNLSDFEFATIGDSLYPNNRPVHFDDHNVFKTRLAFSYTPKQLYLKEPFEKIVLGSKFPTFSFQISQAWNVFNSPIKFTFADFNIYQQFNVGIIGVSEYRFTMGRFLDTSSMQIMDYRYQRGGDPYFFTPAMYTYQLLDTTFPTFNLFFEGHYVHQFNGFIMNRIPLLKKTNIKTMAGGGFLIAPERQLEYVELFMGLNRIFKVGKERLRLGFYYTLAQSNQFGFRSQYKVSFEFYNRTKNTWSF